MLSINDFDGKNLKNKESGYVLFYADWCGHCKKLKPIWEEFKNDSKDKGFMVSSFDCSKGSEDPNIGELTGRFGVKGFPTVHYFLNGVHTGQYEGERNLEALKRHSEHNMKSGTKTIINSDSSVKSPNYLMWILIFIILLLSVACAYMFINRKKGKK
jgi:thiol-disulfide isomerase/thioredoxin